MPIEVVSRGCEELEALLLFAGPVEQPDGFRCCTGAGQRPALELAVFGAGMTALRGVVDDDEESLRWPVALDGRFHPLPAHGVPRVNLRLLLWPVAGLRHPVDEVDAVL